jgi:hypothetical protein
VPLELLAKRDAQAALLSISRAAYIKQAVSRVFEPGVKDKISYSFQKFIHQG